ncbi:IscS subfamily cysteine desulfurase [Gynuella sunshinyii]|uniref:Cysteine desulfurase IscS n=1 Tax=Gynuella sunshinyii YC6258 TaxID=1445510 RepID=A0A0C5VU11_9GAMM|nr:IscS subfamily cysteine desulfurase [Gynuella sunshinyii]AJQ96768.1 cysteine sulfinate desulfinase/cysteine desulfurase-related enzyme [Gynuella sunshinyii YC6258]
MKLPVYLDYAASTPVDPRVAKLMGDCLTMEGNFGNPASRSHVYGWQAEEAVEEARRQVADLIGAEPREIVWTSGATESNNLAIKGVLEQYGEERGRHIITSAIEHKAVLDPCQYLQSRGCEVTFLQPDDQGLISVEQVRQALRPDTVLVSLMHVNNEIGVINPVAGVGELCRSRDILFHVDAAQSAGKLPVNVQAMHIDLLSLSAHKFYGPKGMGALFVRRQPQVRVAPLIHGGGHERGMRSGTLATHQIAGMGKAAQLARQEQSDELERIASLKDLLWGSIRDLPGVSLNGHPEQRLPSILNVAFDGLDGEMLLMSLKDLAISTGSACTSASLEPSYVLRAIGVDTQLAHSSLRISLGRFTDRAQVEFAIQHIRSTVERMRAVTGQTV